MSSKEEARELLQIGIELQLKKIFAKGHFDVCGFGDILKAMGGSRGDIPDDVQLFHCVDYAAMGPEVKAKLFKRCVGIMAEVCCWNNFVKETCDHLGLDEHANHKITIELEHPKGFFQRLLGA